MIERSEKITTISLALLEAQKKITSVIKNAKSHHGKYADFNAVIEELKEPLNEQGVLLLQSVSIARSSNGEPDKPVLETALIHAESGEYFCSNTPICCQSPNDPQKMGSGITYAKRYGLQAMGVLPSEDDDGKGATKKPKAKKPTKKQQAFIDMVVDSLVDIASESGRVPDKGAIENFLFDLKGGFLPDDTKKVGECVKYIAAEETRLYAVTKEK